MCALYRGVYGGRYPRIGPFGLSSNQHYPPFAHAFAFDCSWYNKKGEKLGFGTLATPDFLRIGDEIDEGELFILLDRRSASPRRLVGGQFHSAMTKWQEWQPGIEYVAANCKFIIARGMIYVLSEYVFGKDRSEQYGIPLTLISAEQARHIITTVSQ